MFRLHAVLLPRWLAAACAFSMVSTVGAQSVTPPVPDAPAPAAAPAHYRVSDEPVELARMEVSAQADDAGYDRTGMGSYEHQLRDPPFWNDMISVDAIEDDPAAMEIAAEMGIIATPSAVDLATGDSRVGLRGFPTPQMSNGFVRMGGIDVLNTARTIVIQGALVPVLGRAAPGGIQDFWTNRPRTAKAQQIEYSLSSLERQTAALEVNGPAVPKRVWYRVASDWSRKTGPETFAATETRSINGAVTWRHSAAASTLFSVDYRQTHATAAPGIPEYREATGRKIAGPYRPLAGFNALGPEAGVRRRSMVANIILDAQPHPKIAMRAGVEAWWRGIEQDRFTTGLLNLSTGRFEGTREPRHSEQPQSALVARAEATARFAAFRGEHKLMVAASHTMSDYLRGERALSTALRNALPASVRIFDPAAPDYFRPPYDPETYDRIITNRRERTRYTAIELSERLGIAHGRTVFTTGLRQDFVGLELNDRRVGLPESQAHVNDRAGQLTYHFGLNYQAVPSRLLLFATTSTAFNPSTRVDVRTGRIQGNETTRGYEGGFKARFAKRQIELTTSFFTFFNEDISRRNPLYDDPVFDANDTQPQLVAAGEETFTGGKIEGRWKPIAPMTLTLRGTYVRAITTASPDLPEEVGRELTRFPPFNLSMAASYRFSGRLRGLSLSSRWSHISDFVASHEDRQRHRLDYPSYSIVSISASYSKRVGKVTHGVGLVVRNVFDTDLLAKLARLGAGRELSASYRLMW
ncbi:MAG: TonB-dependent receptor domain-containing protein [Opitutaceae bacterium]